MLTFTVYSVYMSAAYAMELTNCVREAAAPLRDLAQRARRRFLRMREKRRLRRDARYAEPNPTRSLYTADNSIVVKPERKTLPSNPRAVINWILRRGLLLRTLL